MMPSFTRLAGAVALIGAMMPACSSDGGAACDADVETCATSDTVAADAVDVPVPGSIADCVGIMSCRDACADDACRDACVAGGTSEAAASASAWIACQASCQGSDQHFYSCFADTCFEAFSTCGGEEPTLSCYRVLRCESDGDPTTRNCAQQAQDAKSLGRYGDVLGCIRVNCADQGDPSSQCTNSVLADGGACEAVSDICGADCTTTADCEPPVCGSGQCTCNATRCEVN